MAELRVGLVGCGGIGAVHARSWAQVPDAAIVAVCEPDAERAALVAAPRFDDLDTMLSEIELDAVDICTPPHLHSAQALAALQAGRAVLCEKPLARSAAEARPIVEAAERLGLPLMTAFCHRFHPPVEYVRELIQSGTLGRVLMFRNRFGTRFRGVEHRWFSKKEVAGGGALMDTSVHSVDLFRYLVGEVREARALTANYHPEIHGVDDSAVMTLRSTDGALGVIEASWQTPWSANVVEIYGELGAAVIDYDTGVTRHRLEADPEWTNAPELPGDRFVSELVHLAAVLGGRDTLRVTGRDGLRALEVLEDAVRA